MSQNCGNCGQPFSFTFNSGIPQTLCGCNTSGDCGCWGRSFPTTTNCQPCSADCTDMIKTECIVYSGDDIDCLSDPILASTGLTDVIISLGNQICELQNNPSDISRPNQEVVYGTGTGISSDSNFLWDYVHYNLVVGDLNSDTSQMAISLDNQIGDIVLESDKCSITLTGTLGTYSRSAVDGINIDSKNGHYSFGNQSNGGGYIDIDDSTKKVSFNLATNGSFGTNAYYFPLGKATQTYSVLTDVSANGTLTWNKLALENLSDVVISTVANGDTIIWNSTSSNWVNSTWIPTYSTSSAFFTALNTSKLVTNFVRVKGDGTSNDGLTFQVIYPGGITNRGIGVFYDPDYNMPNSGTYNDAVIFAETGIHPSSTTPNLGIWNSGLGAVLGNIAIWGGFHWINNGTGNGSATNQTTLSVGEWVKLTKTTTGGNPQLKGYLRSTDEILANIDTGALTISLIQRKDFNGNVVTGTTNINNFPWRNRHVTYQNINNSVTLPTSFINISDTLLNNTAQPGLSNYPATIASAATIDLTNYNYVGIVTLSGNTGVGAFTNFPANQPVRFYATGTNAITFTSGSGFTLSSSTITITGHTTYSDYIELIKVGNVIIENNSKIY